MPSHAKREYPSLILRLKGFMFWDIAQCNSLKVNGRFGGRYRLPLQGRRISKKKTSEKQVTSRATWLCVT